jgi:hypothetical protein
MLLRHRLARLIWTAIFVIAVQLVAGPASAHRGHFHTHSPAAHVSATQSADQGRLVIKTQLVAEQADIFVGTPDQPDLPVSTQSGGCPGGCCGSGVGCCGAALAVSSNSLPDVRAMVAVVLFAFRRSSGMDPEGLARPPRTLV